MRATMLATVLSGLAAVGGPALAATVKSDIAPNRFGENWHCSGVTPTIPDIDSDGTDDVRPTGRAADVVQLDTALAGISALRLMDISASRRRG
ncbi:MAG: hypothetical protein ACU0DK_12200 [Pseudooceanicola sp.]